VNARDFAGDRDREVVHGRAHEIRLLGGAPAVRCGRLENQVPSPALGDERGEV